MKNLIKFKKLAGMFLLASGAMLLKSCVVYNNPYRMPSVPVSDIVQMSKDGVSSKNIIKEIRQTHSVYTLKANQLAELRNEGVQDSVINYMEYTHLAAIRYNQQMSDSYYGWPGYYGMYNGIGFGWPWWYDGWGWGWGLGWGWNYGPTIIYSGHGGYHGDFHGGGFRGGGVRGGGFRGGRR